MTSVLPRQNNEQSVFKEIGDIMKKPFTLLETCIAYYSFNTDVVYDSNVVNKMSILLLLQTSSR